MKQMATKTLKIYIKNHDHSTQNVPILKDAFNIKIRNAVHFLRAQCIYAWILKPR